MRACRFGGISLLVAGMMAQGFPALAQTDGTTPAPAGSASAAPPTPEGSASAAPPAAPPQQNPPDVVELEDGGMYRGTISELVPDDHVVIVTVTGASKTFDMKDVKYAGPASQAPGAAPSPAKPSGEEQPEGAAKPEKKEERTKPMITVHADEARLLVKGDKPGLTLYRKSGSAIAIGSGGSAVASGYDVICTAPCDASLPSGTQTLAVSDGKGAPVEADPVKLPAGESRLTEHYDKKTGLRVAGWLVFAGGVVGGSVLMLVALNHTTKDCSEQYLTGQCTDQSSVDGGVLALAGLVMAAGVGIGMAMAFQPDKASVTITPVDAALLRHPSWSNPALDRASYSSVGAPGLGLTARF